MLEQACEFLLACFPALRADADQVPVGIVVPQRMHVVAAGHADDGNIVIVFDTANHFEERNDWPSMNNPGLPERLWEVLDGRLWHATARDGLKGILADSEIRIVGDRYGSGPVMNGTFRLLLGEGGTVARPA